MSDPGKSFLGRDSTTCFHILSCYIIGQESGYKKLMRPAEKEQAHACCNLLVSWRVPVFVEVQRPYGELGNVKCITQIMSNALFSQSRLYVLLEGSLPNAVQLSLQLCPLLLGEIYQMCLWERPQAVWWTAMVAASQVGRGVRIGLNGHFCGITQSSQILIWYSGLQISKYSTLALL